ncbi:uncharacterized protein [Arachis hypogaea]|uniref:uncharacterized protein n=1 Tax=Arachis hypogaea TaxID=3818 RepID=UPI003B226B23
MVKTTNLNGTHSSPFPSSSSVIQTMSDNDSYPSQNPASPFYTHPRNNYHSWCRSFSIAIISKNKYGFLTGSIPSTSLDDPVYPAWERCNNLVLFWLFHSLSPSITQSIIYLSTASSVWEDLRDRFSQSDLLHIAELQEEIYALKQGSLSVTDFFTALKTLWEEIENSHPLPLCTCPAKTYRNQDFIIRFLKGLDECFSVVRSQLFLLDPLPPVNQVFAMIIQQERQLQAATGILDEQRTIAAVIEGQ